MPRTRYHVCDSSRPHFLTCTVVGWLPLFMRPHAAQCVLDSLRFLQEQARLTLFGYVLMENHLHLIASSSDLSAEVGRFKSFTARSIIDGLEACGAGRLLQLLQYFKLEHKADRLHELWQESSHPQIIENDATMWQKLEYIHMNPVRRGYVDDPVHWRYSSARSCARQTGLIPVTTDW